MLGPSPRPVAFLGPIISVHGFQVFDCTRYFPGQLAAACAAPAPEAPLSGTKRQTNALGPHVRCGGLVGRHQNAGSRELCPMASALAAICAR
jgi:hypothetical protein